MADTNERVQKLVMQTFEDMWFTDNETIQTRITGETHRGDPVYSETFQVYTQLS